MESFSLTLWAAIIILSGAIIYFISNRPKLFSIINIVLSVLYFLFVVNIIRFNIQSKQKLLLINLVILCGLALWQTIGAKKKYAVASSIMQLFASLTAILANLRIIKTIFFV